MSEYRVIITETLKRAVTVEAESREEAEEAVRRQYQNSEHILVAEDFDGDKEHQGAGRKYKHVR